METDLLILGKQLRDFKDWIESHVDKVHPDLGDGPRAPTGDPYVTLACGGLKRDGEPDPLFAGNLDDLFKYARHGFLEYISSIPNSGPTTLYWRKHPIVDESREETDDGMRWAMSVRYSIRMRLVIVSEKS